MAISFDQALGVHEQALQARVKRAEVLANNLANADTPGYKARDVDFQAMMQQAHEKVSGLQMSRTDDAHMDTSAGGSDSELLYRTPHQPSVDGNTVDAQQEQSRFMRNAMDYQASFQFLSSKFSGLTKALKGE
ncbi:flagellar basal body rod protein FlgB [Marinobacter qingdaonensis]|jgi:flagellar basal-body rod protein FlgB|uniref:Flagellar basal body rod protein FlgB n=1 Tax=Marinobacter qingdaonensis TaxID=3108486 RepID=A0ABU5P2H9_9GAMM|nr:flagellar basal body rod protein FlgB [Marinobacter sp. ASW11-75]MEA1082283.1 flagellar basal body rod protein FlgB [Marinobacter sp. ASW11-75]MEE2763921.1 flagellar basal body rod protein FlgB [Pseudomonadota bacterium]MEE3117717.1 flagellar basal body rod protein FlgB [Pseudomonadota bacterium]